MSQEAKTLLSVNDAKRIRLAERKDWKIALASRTVSGSDLWTAKAVGICTCSNTTHIEILVVVECDGAACKWKDLIDRKEIQKTSPQLKVKHRGNGTQHILAFSARNNAVDSGIVVYLDPIYQKTGGWEYIAFGTDFSPEELDAKVKRLIDFWLEHNGDGYSHECYCVANVCCCYCCIAFCGETPCGVTSKQIARSDGKISSRKWNCSEISAASLLAAGFLPKGAVEPSVSSPDTVYTAILAHGHRMLTYAEATAVRHKKSEAETMKRDDEDEQLRALSACAL